MRRIVIIACCSVILFTGCGKKANPINTTLGTSYSSLNKNLEYSVKVGNCDFLLPKLNYSIKNSNVVDGSDKDIRIIITNGPKDFKNRLSDFGFKEMISISELELCYKNTVDFKQEYGKIDNKSFYIYRCKEFTLVCISNKDGDIGLDQCNVTSISILNNVKFN